MDIKILNCLSLLILAWLAIDSAIGNSTLDQLTKQLAVANNYFGLNLYHKLSKGSSTNVFISPLSLSSAFGMVFAGASGNSAKQLRSVLGFDAAHLDNKQVSSSFYQYLAQLLPKTSKNYTLNLTNKQLLSNYFYIDPAYRKEVQNYFHANIEEVDFARNSYQIVNDVNGWVRSQTAGKINNLLNEIDPQTVLLLLNAIYFKGSWATPFDKRLTHSQTFYNDGMKTNTKILPFMNIDKGLPYASFADFQVLEMPYEGGNISMLVLLPKQFDGLPSLEQSLSVNNILAIQKELVMTEVLVTFPKFKIEYSRQMNEDLKAIGVKDVFAPYLANLSGMSPDNGAYISQVIHKAIIEVNEEGSEAAAVTGIKIIPYNLPEKRPPIFKADHPFMFAIVDKSNNLIIFLGRVNHF